jgi:hypothetical protein
VAFRQSGAIADLLDRCAPTGFGIASARVASALALAMSGSARAAIRCRTTPSSVGVRPERKLGAVSTAAATSLAWASTKATRSPAFIAAR